MSIPIGSVIERHPEIKIVADDSLFGCSHNFPCPVCRKRRAILNPCGMFEPCWDCQAQGFFLLDARKLRPWRLWELWSKVKQAIQRATLNRRMYDQE